MGQGPAHTRRVAAAAGRRAALRDLVLGLGWGLTAGAVAASVLIGAIKLRVLDLPWTVAMGAGLGAGVIAAGLWTVSRLWSLERAAAELDHRLGLKDRLATGVALGRKDDSFSVWAVEDAERTASEVRVGAAIPVRAGWPWGVWPVLVAGAIALSLFVPVRPRSTAGRPEPTREEREQAAAQVRRAADAIRQGQPDAKIEPATARQLESLHDLERELTEGRVDPKDATVQAAKHVEDMAKRLESQAQADAARADAMKESLAEAADKASSPETEKTSPLTEAIRKGDFESAAKAAEETLKQAPTMSPAEREQLAGELERLAEAIEAERERAKHEASTQTPPKKPDGPDSSEQASKPPESEQPKPPDQAAEERRAEKELRDALRDAAKELREPPKPESDPKPEASKQQPLDPSPREGQKAPKEGQTGQTGDSGQRQSNPQPDGSSGPTGSTGGTSTQPQGQPKGQPGNTGPSADQSKDGQAKPKGQPGSTGTPQPQPGSSGASGSTGATADGQSKPQGDTGATGTQRQPSGQPQGASGSTGQTGTTSAPRPNPDGQPGQSGATGMTSPEGQSGQTGPTSQTPHGAPSGPTGQPPGGSTGSTGQAPSGQPSPTGSPIGNAPETGEKGSGMERFAKTMKRLADGNGQRQQDMERARQAEQIARKMMEEATPEQREQLRKQIEDFAKSGQRGGPGSEPASLTSRSGASPRETRTAPVDARRPATVSGNEKPPERTIAEWYSDKQGPHEGTSQAPAERMRQAAQGVERAIEGQQIPGRYQDLVRRVFRRYAEQAPPK